MLVLSLSQQKDLYHSQALKSALCCHIFFWFYSLMLQTYIYDMSIRSRAKFTFLQLNAPYFQRCIAKNVFSSFASLLKISYMYVRASAFVFCILLHCFIDNTYVTTTLSWLYFSYAVMPTYLQYCWSNIFSKQFFSRSFYHSFHWELVESIDQVEEILVFTHTDSFDPKTTCVFLYLLSFMSLISLSILWKIFCQMYLQFHYLIYEYLFVVYCWIIRLTNLMT